MIVKQNYTSHKQGNKLYGTPHGQTPARPTGERGTYIYPAAFLPREMHSISAKGASASGMTSIGKPMVFPPVARLAFGGCEGG